MIEESPHDIVGTFLFDTFTEMLRFQLIRVSLAVLALPVILASCTNTSSNDEEFMAEVRSSTSKTLLEQNQQARKWMKEKANLKALATVDQKKAISQIDSLLNSKTLELDQLDELHALKGNIYYKMDSFQKSVIEFGTAAQRLNMQSPRDLAGRAGAYIKLKQYPDALSDLKAAAAINYDYYWNLGNYFEIVGNRDSAAFYYTKLFTKDTIYYRFCRDRATELAQPQAKLMKELKYIDTSETVLLVKPVQ
ncbi:tetratricopeptide repeat protein [Taibaiella soli]|uniref:Tetratricopeptide repeat protein n=1 Tax=Taibaiella soli TaxID=1649169 RepID=A0A2W2B681_9BACT|nr:hypothetical protein [Taibaiella soli]PZF71719.1 hypothetical protein DN068_16765 [Taibaiella soli]